MRSSQWGPGCGCLHRTGQVWPRPGGTQQEGKAGFAGGGEAPAKPPSTCTDPGRIPASPATRSKCLWLKPPVLRRSGLDTHRAPQSQSGRCWGLTVRPSTLSVESLDFLPRQLSGQDSVSQCRRPRRPGYDPWVGKSPWSRKWQPPQCSHPGCPLPPTSLSPSQSGGHRRAVASVLRTEDTEQGSRAG